MAHIQTKFHRNSFSSSQVQTDRQTWPELYPFTSCTSCKEFTDRLVNGLLTASDKGLENPISRSSVICHLSVEENPHKMQLGYQHLLCQFLQGYEVICWGNISTESHTASLTGSLEFVILRVAYNWSFSWGSYRYSWWSILSESRKKREQFSTNTPHFDGKEPSLKRQIYILNKKRWKEVDVSEFSCEYHQVQGMYHVWFFKHSYIPPYRVASYKDLQSSWWLSSRALSGMQAWFNLLISNVETFEIL
jgi:hypothetical protein